MRAALLCLLLVVPAACGGESAAESTPDPDEPGLAFARCMREHGIDMPDPETDGGRTRIAIAGKADDVDAEKLEAAQKACEKHLPDGGPGTLDPETQAEVQEAMLAFARCMREHGVDMPDPDPNGRGIVVKGNRADPDFDGQKFRDAEKACRKHTEQIDSKLGVTRERR